MTGPDPDEPHPMPGFPRVGFLRPFARGRANVEIGRYSYYDDPDGPERFFVPPYVGSKGWVGARLDAAQDWDELAELLEDSYRLIAPKRLSALLDRPSAEAP